MQQSQDNYEDSEYREYNRFRYEQESQSRDEEINDDMPSFPKEEAISKFEDQNKIKNEKAHDLSNDNKEMTNDYFPDPIFENLPVFLKKVTDPYKVNKRERDIVLVSALITASACFPTISGTYDDDKVYSNLFGIILASTGGGKGRAKYGVRIANDIDKLITGELYNKEGNISIAEVAGSSPTQSKRFLISANSSSAALLEDMNRNKGLGNMIFESELDIASSVSKEDWGRGYSETFRKAYHHESLSSNRKKDGVLVVDTPKLSALFTGTPSQLKGFVRSRHDGLLSRFLFYIFTGASSFKDVSSRGKKISIELYQKQLSEELLSIFQWFRKKEIKFNFTDVQWDEFHEYFVKVFADAQKEYGEEILGTIERLGVATFRIAMILSAFSSFEVKSDKDTIICNDKDFYTAMSLSKTFLQHALTVYESIKGPGFEVESEIKELFYESLPQGEFARKDALASGLEIGMKERNIDETLKGWLISKRLRQPKTGFYSKP